MLAVYRIRTTKCRRRTDIHFFGNIEINNLLHFWTYFFIKKFTGHACPPGDDICRSNCEILPVSDRWPALISRPDRKFSLNKWIIESSQSFFWQILSWFSRIHIHVDGLTVLFECVKRLGLQAFIFGFKFPVGGSAPDIQPTQKTAVCEP